MYASMFHLDLGDELSSRERGRIGRALAAHLAALQGFVAFIALESADGAVGGLCICADAVTLAEAQRIAESWQRARVGASAALTPYASGKVIVQHGF